MEVNLLRIVQEALTNVVRHALATRATVVVTVTRGLVEVEVTDNGVGRGDAERGVGTCSMHERADELSGTLTITTGSDGRGTCVRVGIPW